MARIYLLTLDLKTCFCCVYGECACHKQKLNCLLVNLLNFQYLNVWQSFLFLNSCLYAFLYINLKVFQTIGCIDIASSILNLDDPLLKSFFLSPEKIPSDPRGMWNSNWLKPHDFSGTRSQGTRCTLARETPGTPTYLWPPTVRR